MKLEDLKELWRYRCREDDAERFRRLAAEVVARTDRFESAILRRDRIEWAAGVLVLALFGGALLGAPGNAAVRLGHVIIMLGTVLILAVMEWGRRVDLKPEPGAPLAEFAAAELRRIDRQIALLRNAIWWYAAPILSGAMVFLYGILSLVPELPRATFYTFLAGFFACILLAGLIIVRGNSRAADRDLVPLREELTALIAALEDKPGD
ncbi:MAG: hypothetical protein AAGA92_07980 [Planctomycetota bacterium]